MSINQETNNQESLQNANGLCLLQFESLCYTYSARSENYESIDFGEEKFDEENIDAQSAKKKKSTE